MKLTIEREAAQKAVAAVRGVVERRNAIPILANVKLEAFGGQLSLTATDLDSEAWTLVEAVGVAGGSTTVHGERLFELLRSLPAGGDVMLELGERLVVTCGRARYEMPVLPPEDFPDFPAVEDAAGGPIPSSELQRLFEKTAFAVSKEETRYYLNGVYLHRSGDDLVAVATDGHRLALARTEVPEGFEAWPAVIIPRKTVAEMRRLTGDAGEVYLRSNGLRISVETDCNRLVSKLIDGQFPDYTRVLPADGPARMDVEVAPLSAALRRAIVVGTEKLRSAVLEAQAGKLSLTATDAEGGRFEEAVDVAYAGPDVRQRFNVAYLLEALAQVEGGAAVLQLDPDNGPAKVLDPLDPQMVQVVMPLRV